MLRCAASKLIAAYANVRLIPQDLRALPAELFKKPSQFQGFLPIVTSPSDPWDHVTVRAFPVDP